MPETPSATPRAPFDAAAFRGALGSFATGVTIITARHAEDVGVTANSFNSVSLDPPMVLWSLGRNARSLPTFLQAEYFAVHILAEDQADLSAHFASKATDKFAGVAVTRGHGETPLLEGCAARFECRKVFEYDGGDHTIFVGEVLAFDHAQKRPLVFHAGRYATATPHADPASEDGEGLAWLMMRAHFSMRAAALHHAEQLCLSARDRHVLGALLGHDGRTIAEINGLIGYSGIAADGAVADRLVAQGYVTRAADAPDALSLTEKGREGILAIIAATKASEAEAEMRLGPHAAATLKHLLKELVDANLDPRMTRHLDMVRGAIDEEPG